MLHKEKQTKINEINPKGLRTLKVNEKKLKKRKSKSICQIHFESHFFNSHISLSSKLRNFIIG